MQAFAWMKYTSVVHINTPLCRKQRFIESNAIFVSIVTLLRIFRAILFASFSEIAFFQHSTLQHTQIDAQNSAEIYIEQLTISGPIFPINLNFLHILQLFLCIVIVVRRDCLDCHGRCFLIQFFFTFLLLVDDVVTVVDDSDDIFCSSPISRDNFQLTSCWSASFSSALKGRTRGSNNNVCQTICYYYSSAFVSREEKRYRQTRCTTSTIHHP